MALIDSNGAARWTAGVASLIGAVAAVDLVAMVLITVVDVVGRYLFSAPLVGADELTVFAMAICTFAGLPLVVARGAMIRVEVLHVVLGPAATRLLGAAMNAVAGAFLLFCAWRLTVKAQGLASYGDSTMFLHLKTAPLAWGMAAACAVSGLLMLALALTARERLLPRDAGEGGL